MKADWIAGAGDATASMMVSKKSLWNVGGVRYSDLRSTDSASTLAVLTDFGKGFNVR